LASGPIIKKHVPWLNQIFGEAIVTIIMIVTVVVVDDRGRLQVIELMRRSNNWRTRKISPRG
jgi:hypothetical protein